MDQVRPVPALRGDTTMWDCFSHTVSQMVNSTKKSSPRDERERALWASGRCYEQRREFGPADGSDVKLRRKKRLRVVSGSGAEHWSTCS